MAISVKKFVDIGSVAVEQATIDASGGMHLRVFTQTPFNINGVAVPPILDVLALPLVDRQAALVATAASLVKFGSAAEVLAAFGETSEEYRIAVTYFNCRNRVTNDRPPLIEFQRWNQSTIPSQIVGSPVSDLVALQAITAGLLAVVDTTLNITYELDPIDLSGATSLDAAAQLIQLAIAQESALVGTTMSYANGSFVFSDQTSLNAARFSVVGAGGDATLVTAIGFLSGTTFVPGTPSMSATSAFANSVELDSYFFSTIFTADAALGIQDVRVLAEAIDANPAGATSHGNLYMYCVEVEASAVPTYITDVLPANLQCLAVTLKKQGEYHAAIPAGICANVDYLKRNAFTQAMWTVVSGVSPSVFDTTYSIQLDNARVNYYGQIRVLGGNREGFFKGALFTNAPTLFKDFYIYAGAEYVRRAACKTAVDVLATRDAPANAIGKTIIDVALRTLFNSLLESTVVIKEKAFSDADRSTIINLTDDPNAAIEVEAKGYYYQSQFKLGAPTTLQYTAVFAAGNKITKIEGTHSFITAQ